MTPEAGVRVWDNVDEARTFVPGGWQLVARLAADRFGERYLVASGGPRRRRSAVLRRIHPRLTAADGFERALRAEARVAAASTHANVARVLELGRDEAGLYVLTEQPDGLTASALLDRLRDRGRELPADLAVEIVVQASHGLRAARALAGLGAARGPLPSLVGVDEVLVGDDGIVRLLVAGLASAALPLGADAQAGARLMDDVAALGRLLFELLTLRTPPPRELAREARVAAVLHRLRPDLPEALVELCARSVGGDAARRPRGTVDLTADLTRCAGTSTDAPRRLAALVRELGDDGAGLDEAVLAHALLDADTAIDAAIDAAAELDDRATVQTPIVRPTATLGASAPPRLARGSQPPPDGEPPTIEDEPTGDDRAVIARIVDRARTIEDDAPTIGEPGPAALARAIAEITPAPEPLPLVDVRARPAARRARSGTTPLPLPAPPTEPDGVPALRSWQDVVGLPAAPKPTRPAGDEAPRERVHAGSRASIVRAILVGAALGALVAAVILLARA